MGLAIYLWDFGVKRGDIQALSAFSYFEPFIAALLVAALGQGTLGWNVAIGGVLIVAGAVIASKGIWGGGGATLDPVARGGSALARRERPGQKPFGRIRRAEEDPPAAGFNGRTRLRR
jgi:hypothetical protein